MIDYDNEPKLSILNVADKCGINYTQEGKRFTGVCPFCGASLGHFYLTPDDGKYKNVFRCVKCGEHGNQYKLYAYMKGFLNDPEYNKRACKELMGFDVETDTIKSIKQSKEVANIKQNPMAPIEIRNTVYRKLIRKLSLSEKHYLNLGNRGLNDVNILKNGYKTLPFDENLKQKICWDIMHKTGFNLAGVPGFHTKHNDWTFWTPKQGGFLVPAIDYLGRVQACQVRKDTLKKKYTWFSSSYMENGTPCTGFVHVHWNSSHSLKKVIITEGALKGTISSILSDTTFVCIPGVNSINQLIPTLKTMENRFGKIERIFTAFDMDKFKNKDVLMAEQKLLSLLLKNQYTDLKISNWNKAYKGIDDYMLHVVHIKDESIALEK